MLDLALAFLVTSLSCWGLGRLAPEADGSFDRFLAARVGRMTGRAATVLVVIAVGIGVLHRSPAAVTAGALAGWLLAAALELRGRSPRGGREQP